MTIEELQKESRKLFIEYVNALAASKKAEDEYINSRKRGLSKTTRNELKEVWDKLKSAENKATVAWEIMNAKVCAVLEAKREL